MAVLATVRMAQRTATGADQSAKTTFHLLRGVRGQDDIDLYLDDDARALTREPLDAEEIGVVEIVHPWMVWGDPDDVLERMYFAAVRALREAGVIKADDRGIYFLA